MAKLLCHLLMKVNHVMIVNFYVGNMSFNAIHENKILAKISEFTVYQNPYVFMPKMKFQSNFNVI